MPSPEDRFNVSRNDDNLVCAKYLTYYGQLVYAPYHNNFDPNKNENCCLFLVADDFCFEDFLIKYYNMAVPILQHRTSKWGGEGRYRVTVDSILTGHFWPNCEDDLQRTYGGASNGASGFVLAFRPAANFVFGIACDMFGLTFDDCEIAAGLVNYKAYLENPKQVDISGPHHDSWKNYYCHKYGYTWADYYMVPKVTSAVNQNASNWGW